MFLFCSQRHTESGRQAGPVSQNQICQSEQYIQFGRLLLQTLIPRLSISKLPLYYAEDMFHFRPNRRFLVLPALELPLRSGRLREGIVAVDKGTELVRKTSEDFSEAAAETDKVIKLIEDISVQTQEQAAAISQISIGVEQISSVVQMNSATSEESAAASEELSSQAGVLKGLAEKAKLGKSYRS